MNRSRGRRIPALQGAIDLGLASGAMLGAWWLASVGILPITKTLPELGAYLKALPPVLAVLLVLSLVFRLYRTRRAGSYGALLGDVLKVNLQATLVILALGFYYRGFSYSRVIITTYFAANTVLMFLHHVAWMTWERQRYSRGIGARSSAIIGVGMLARELSERIESHPWTGLAVVGFIDTGAGGAAAEPARVPLDRILGTVEDLGELIEHRRIEEVLVAVPLSDLGVLPDLDALLSRSNVGLRWVPDLLALSSLGSDVSDLDGLHVIDLRGVRTVGFGGALKRALDIFGAATLLVLCSPVFAFIALRILLAQGRPVIFRQERMGLDGRVFPMLKFRTMALDAEAETGPVWAQEDDPRVTRAGRWLRKLSLDELPQLWNVLVGDMSLVGPRPERPIFIEKFRHTVPNYMLRHRMKAGLTGWAQIHGWRGNTSIEKRIQCDLYYAKHWSIWLDLKILILTPLRSWGRSRNAY